MNRRAISWILWGLAYLACAGAITAAAWRGRQSAIAVYESPEGRAEWREWKEAAQAMEEKGGSLARRAPKSDEPPALVLLRDHFVTCLAGLLLAFTALFGVLMVLVRGAYGQRSNQEIPQADVRSPRPGIPGERGRG
jgi:hypothetical protein